MGAYAALFGEDQESSQDLVSPKKSSMSGFNKGLQPEEETDDLDAIMRGSVERNKKKKETSFAEKAIGAGEAGLSALTGAVAYPLGAATGIVSAVRSGKFGTQAGIRAGEEQARNLQQQMIYQPRTEQGQEYIQSLQKAFEESKLPPVMPEALGMRVERQLAGKAGEIAKQQLQSQFGNIKRPTIRMENVPTATGQQGQFAGQNAGAAATGIEAELRSELAKAKPEIQQAFANATPESFTPENLKVVKNHNQFEKFDMTPTEGQALENPQLMSDEYNARKVDPNIREAYERRDQKLIEGFNKIRQEVSPDVFESDPVKLANSPLEKLVSIDKQKLKDIDTAYKDFFNAGGKESPVDAQTLAKTAIDNLHRNYLYEDAPASIRNALERHLEGEPMTFEQFSALIKRASTMQREGGTSAQVGTQLRNALETLPLKDTAAELKDLRDIASGLAKQRYDLIDTVPAYKAAALGDTRTTAQIAQGVPHPAASTFLDKYYGAKTPEVDIRNLLDIIGEGSPEHQALNAALIDKFKKGSGIVDDKGIVKQAALNKQIHDLYKSNKGVMFGHNAIIDLEDLADVARKTEPTAGRHSVNTSNTAVVQEQGALKNATEAAKNIAATGIEHGVNVAAKGIPVGTVIREAFKGKKAKEAALAEAKAAEELSKRRLSPTAGIKISDIPRIDLRGMANKE